MDLASKKVWGDYTVTPIPHLTGKKVSPIRSTGHLKGTYENAILEGRSDLYGSNSEYKITLKGEEAQKVVADLKGISLAKMVQEMGEKPSLEGKIDVSILIDDAREGKLKGLSLHICMTLNRM